MFLDKIAPIQPLSATFFDSRYNLYSKPDYALPCLHYALTRPRAEGGMSLFGEFLNFTFADNPIERIYNVFDFITHENDDVHFFYIRVSSFQMQEISKSMPENVGTRLSLLEKFIFEKASTETLVYHNPEINLACIVSPAENMAVYHLIYSFYSMLYPNLFKDKPLTDDEIEAMRSLTYKNPEPFMVAISKLLKPYEQEILKSQLEECFNSFRQAKLRQAEQKVNSTRNQMDSLMKQYSEYAKLLDEEIIRYEGLRYTTESTEEETKNLIEYISSSENLMNVNYANGILMFDAKTLLINIDPDKWLNAVRYKGIYDGYTIDSDSVFSIQNNRKMLLNAIFGSEDPDLYVKVWGRITLGISNCYMNTSKFIDMSDDSILKDYLMNPHFARYACPGRNRDQIVACLQRYELITAMECSVAATGSVNIDETEQNFRPFVQQILTSKNKIIHNNAENKDMTPEEALLWLMEKEKKNASTQDD